MGSLAGNFNPDTHVRYSKNQYSVPRIVCADGFSMSVQASHIHYCKPRNDKGPYTHFEIGYPTQACDELTPYAEEPDKPTDTVYAYVPAAIIKDVVLRHGGVIDPAAEIVRLRSIIAGASK